MTLDYYHEIEVYTIDPGEQVSCLYCRRGWEDPTYIRGEAVLAGADHPPYDANANYICLGHIVDWAVIYDVPIPGKGKGRITREQYEAMGGRPEACWWHL